MDLHRGLGYWYGPELGDQSYGDVNVLLNINNLADDNELGWLKFNGHWGSSHIEKKFDPKYFDSPYLFPYVQYDRNNVLPGGVEPHRWTQPARWIESLAIEDNLNIINADLKMHYSDISQKGGNIIISGFSVTYGDEFLEPLEKINIYYKNRNGDWILYYNYDPRTTSLGPITIPENQIPLGQIELFACDVIDTSNQWSEPLSEKAHENTFEYFRKDQIKIEWTTDDEDSDGLPDDWEMLYFQNLDQGPGDDRERGGLGDGLTNLEEYQHGTDPTKEDSDSGGEWDGSEVAHGRNPLYAGDDYIAAKFILPSAIYLLLLERELAY